MHIQLQKHHFLSLLSMLLLLSPALISAAGMTGEWCQSACSVTASSRRFSSVQLSCLPSILPLPIIVNQSSTVSAGGAVGLETARAAGCIEQQAAYHQRRATRGPFQEAARTGWHAKNKSFAFSIHEAHG